MIYECRFKVALIETEGKDSPKAYLLTPAGSFVRLANGQNELALAAGEIDSDKDGSYGMPRVTQSILSDQINIIASRPAKESEEFALAA